MIKTTKPGVVNMIALPVTDVLLDRLQAALNHLSADLGLTQATGYQGAAAGQFGKGMEGIVFFNTQDQATGRIDAVTQWWKEQLPEESGVVGPGHMSPNPTVEPDARMVWSLPPWAPVPPLPGVKHAAVGR